MENIRVYIDKAVMYRAIETAIADQYANQKMRCPVHLSIGQEYWLPFLKKNIDGKVRCFSSHRSHSMYLALEGDLNSMIEELYGLQTGCLMGRGGSMHLKDLTVGLEASVPIVGSSLPLALGSAFSAKHNNQRILTIAYFGDGACEEGVLHECLNYASANMLPILFICENNLYSCNTSLSKRQPADNMTRFADAARIRTFQLGSTSSFEEIDLVLSRSITCSYSAPIFLEIKSYRLYEHCGYRIDRDSGDRVHSEYDLFEKLDPITVEVNQNPASKELFDRTYQMIVSICSSIESSL
jgi:TPP-dependent pyruvate/acetoin dehydrogenase alpha subunit